MFTLALALSLAGLLIGPTLVLLASRRPVAIAAIDGATLGVVPALLLVRLLPHLVEEVGVAAFVGLGMGYGLYQVIESFEHRRFARAGLALVLPALALHSFLDGTGLALACSGATSPAGGAALAAALVIHKLPEGLFVASRFTEVGARRAFGRVGALGGSMILGAVCGREFLERSPHAVLHVVVAVGLGVMLRTVVHRHGEPEAGSRERAASGCAFVLCLIPVVLLPSPVRVLDLSQPDELSALGALVPLFLESAPCLLVVLLISEVAHGWITCAREDGEETSSAWAATTALSLVLLGPIFALVRAVLDPMFRAMVRLDRGAPPMRDYIAPRAARVLPSYSAAVVLSMAAEAALPGSALILSAPVAVLAAIAAARVLTMGSAGASVVAALLVHKGLPTSAGLAFLLAGAATLPRVAAWRRSVLVLAAVCVTAGLANLVLPATAAASLHSLGAHRHAPYEWVSAAVLAGWTVFELVRQGPRAWIRAAFSRAERGDRPPRASP